MLGAESFQNSKIGITQVTSVEANVCQIDDCEPIPVARPSAVADLSEIVRRAAAERQALYPLGGRTMLDLGLPPERPGLGVDVRGLDRVIDYPARDMTITVQAGMSLDRLQELLGAEKQRLPVDVPLPGRATLGGALAVNASGPRRYGFGTLRDYVIGISVVNDLGHEVKAGGRVVKNVAGYDLCKLYIGALGTLGIITQATLKLRPVPEESALAAWHCPGEQLGPVLEHWQATQTRPVSLTVMNPSGAAAFVGDSETPHSLTLLAGRQPRDWLVLAGFEDNRACVDWQVARAREEMGELGMAVAGEWRGGDAIPLWRMLANYPLTMPGRVIFKANLLPRATADFCLQATRSSDALGILTHAGNGIVIGNFEGEQAQAEKILGSLRAAAAAAQGNLVVVRCPSAWKKFLPVWGTPRGDAWLMRTVKEKLDPRRLFNPGRLF